MKTLRYLLITFAVMIVISVSAQSLAQQPSTEFQSTSSMVGSGSALPQAAQTGAYTTYDIGNPSRSNKPGIRRDDNPFGDETIGGTDKPMEPGTPIGNGMLPLMLLACAYLIWRVARRRARAVNG